VAGFINQIANLSGILQQAKNVYITISNAIKTFSQNLKTS
jgi:hypothetical protein